MWSHSAPVLTLYAIEDSIGAVCDTLEGLPDDELGMRAELEEQLARLVAAELRKVDGIARVLAHFESQAAFASAEIKRLQLRKKRFEAAQERLESSIRVAMECAGTRKLEGESSTLSLRAAPASVSIHDFEAVPAAYKIVKVDTSIDKAAVAKALKAGLEVPGADLSEGNLYLVRAIRLAR